MRNKINQHPLLEILQHFRQWLRVQVKTQLFVKKVSYVFGIKIITGHDLICSGGNLSDIRHADPQTMKLNESKLFGELRINESEFFGEMRMKIRVWRSNIN